MSVEHSPQPLVYTVGFEYDLMALPIWPTVQQAGYETIHGIPNLGHAIIPQTFRSLIQQEWIAFPQAVSLNSL